MRTLRKIHKMLKIRLLFHQLLRCQYRYLIFQCQICKWITNITMRWINQWQITNKLFSNNKKFLRTLPLYNKIIFRSLIYQKYQILCLNIKLMIKKEISLIWLFLKVETRIYYSYISIVLLITTLVVPIIFVKICYMCHVCALYLHEMH